MKIFFQNKRWLQYRLTAKSRHGVHSPFAYHFSENVLYKQNRKGLKQRLSKYFEEYDRIWNKWDIAEVRGNTVLILENIHQTKTAETKWNLLRTQPDVKMSLDIFDFGILVFKKEFLVKQHFVLK